VSLFSAIRTAGTALQTYSTALGADQTNVSNAATPGYAAIKAQILPLGSDGQGGTDRVILTSQGDSVADSVVRSALSQQGASKSATRELSRLTPLFDITGSSGILATFQKFSTAFANAAVNPNDSTLRTIALSAAGQVATALNATASALTTQRADFDSQIASSTRQINSLAGKIAGYNAQVLRDPDPNPAVDAGLRSTLDTLSSLVGIGVSRNADGTVSVLLQSQQPLVLGDQSFSISVNPAAAPGSEVTSSAGGPSQGVTSGQLGSLLQLRSGTLTTLLGSGGTPGQVNTLAKSFADRVNSLLTSGVTASGAPGVPVFTYDPTSPSDVAGTLALVASLTPDQLALATTGASGQSNGIANQLAQLTGSVNPADQIAGLSFQGYFSNIAATVGQAASDAAAQSSADDSTVTAAQASRTQISGVSLDQEAVDITSYQRAYEAASKIVSILDQLTSDEVNLIK
jgi:flagellar hook-associated protein 1 FlgK